MFLTSCIVTYVYAYVCVNSYVCVYIYIYIYTWQGRWHFAHVHHACSCIPDVTSVRKITLHDGTNSKIQSLRGKIQSLRGKIQSLRGKIQSLRGYIRAHWSAQALPYIHDTYHMYIHTKFLHTKSVHKKSTHIHIAYHTHIHTYRAPPTRSLSPLSTLPRPPWLATCSTKVPHNPVE